MNDNTTKLLEQLANKLGTTSGYLWGVLVKQAPVSATITLMYLLLTIAYGFVLYKTYKKAFSVYAMPRFFWIGAAVLFGIIFIILFFSLDNIINGYFNPEYWALNKILESIKSY